MVALNDKSEKMAERKVPIPVIAGKITKAKRKAGVYVLYELERVYDAKKSYNVPKRVTRSTSPRQPYPKSMLKLIAVAA